MSSKVSLVSTRALNFISKYFKRNRIEIKVYFVKLFSFQAIKTQLVYSWRQSLIDRQIVFSFSRGDLINRWIVFFIFERGL